MNKRYRLKYGGGMVGLITYLLGIKANDQISCVSAYLVELRH